MQLIFKNLMLEVTRKCNIPDELGLRCIELPRKGDRLEATCIAYLHPNRPPRNVLLELERCPIEEEFNDVRF